MPKCSYGCFAVPEPPWEWMGSVITCRFRAGKPVHIIMGGCRPTRSVWHRGVVLHAKVEWNHSDPPCNSLVRGCFPLSQCPIPHACKNLPGKSPPHFPNAVMQFKDLARAIQTFFIITLVVFGVALTVLAFGDDTDDADTGPSISPMTVDTCDVVGGGYGTSCTGCDGVPVSGLMYDGCGVCGGDNSSCCVHQTAVIDLVSFPDQEAVAPEVDVHLASDSGPLLAHFGFDLHLYERNNWSWVESASPPVSTAGLADTCVSDSTIFLLTRNLDISFLDPRLSLHTQTAGDPSSAWVSVGDFPFGTACAD